MGAHASQAGAPLSMGAHQSQAGTPLSMGAHQSQAGAPLSMGAHPSQAGATLSMAAHPSQLGAPLSMDAHPSQVTAPLVAQFGAPFVVDAQLATLAGAQPGAVAADLDDKNTNTLLKLASRAPFCELAGNKIKGFVADLELYLRMCARFVHH